MILGGESNNFDLDLGIDVGGPKSPQEGTLGSMIDSLHSMKKYLILKIIGHVEVQDIMVLINLGVSHNFINIRFVDSKGLKVKAFKGFKFFNTNGKLTLVNHIVDIFGVYLQIYMVKEDFYIYPLKGCPYIILRVQRLFYLGDIHTNY